MFGSDILDVAIGLVLVYLLISVLMTSVCEAIEAILKTRAGDLEQALLQLVHGDTALLEKVYQHPLIYSLYKGDYAALTAGKAGTRKRSTLPSYIPRETFSMVVIDLMREDGAANQEFAKAFATLQRVAGFDADATRRMLEGWYDSAMDRASGWFKRRTQFRLFVMGLVLAIIANINSVTIGQYLITHPVARAAVVQAADQAHTRPPDAAGTSSAVQTNKEFYEDYRRQLAAVGLPIGWSDASLERTFAGFPAQLDAGLQGLRWLSALLLLVLGYLATAFAVMLGAPFWFDLLNKLMVVRSTVKPKEKSPDEPPVDGNPAAGAQ
ncbi:hypothetical protein, partial [Niveispirillum sp. KHB5.9]|uniref:hypothetical protein n=1 Tax=Niveispirillum sp. KHB5.9 TaxID=3400269 RepID=UPI003A838C38